MTDTTQTIYRSGLRFLSGTMVSRASGLLRDIVMAFAFGTESALAAFMVAFRFAHLARRLFGEGSLQNTFIPHFEELRAKNPSGAFTFYRDLTASLAVSLLAFIGLGIGVLALLLNSFEWSENLQQILWLTAWMLPSLLFICLYGLNAALLGCEKSFFTAGIAPLAFNLVWILAALLLAPLSIQNAMLGLSIAVVIGCMAQWAVTLPRTFHFLRTSSFHLFSPDVKQFIKPLLLANFGVAASQINNALDPLFALFASSEGPAWLWYAIRIQQLPFALFGIALTNALLPPISRAIKSGNLEQFQHFYHSAYKKIVAFSALITMGIIATAPTCINLLFGRGHFGMESVEGTARCLLAYGLGLFPMTYVLVTAPTLFAFGDYKTPSYASLYAMLLSLVLNSLFIFGFNWDATSVALSTSIAACFNALYLHFTLKKHCQASIEEAFFLKTAFVSIAALSATWSLDFLVLGNVPSLQLMRGIPLALSQRTLDQLSTFGMEGIAFVGTAALAAYALQAKEFYTQK